VVHVLIPAGLSVADAVIALRREAPRLRSEVAAAVTPKRALELCFLPACHDGAALSEASIAPIRTWLAAPMGHDVSAAIERLRRAPDVRQIAVMPDVHLSADVCIGVVVATSHPIYPPAVGGDIGCGMLAVALDRESAVLDDPRVASQVLNDMGRAVPARRRNRSTIIPQPADVAGDRLSHPSLDSIRRKEGATEFATLGSGNHFIEIQVDDDAGCLRVAHVTNDDRGSPGRAPAPRLRALDAKSDAGAEYLHDASCGRFCPRIPNGDGRRGWPSAG
jgi:tRNA-splicing ligase RtcB (3'-phosphate/5'-hydroxy nucleic acid ligase)